MRAEGLLPSAVTYGCLMVACERSRDVNRAFELYRQACDQVRHVEAFTGVSAWQQRTLHTYASNGGSGPARVAMLLAGPRPLAGLPAHPVSLPPCLPPSCLQGIVPNDRMHDMLISMCTEVGCQSINQSASQSVDLSINQ